MTIDVTQALQIMLVVTLAVPVWIFLGPTWRVLRRRAATFDTLKCAIGVFALSAAAFPLFWLITDAQTGAMSDGQVALRVSLHVLMMFAALFVTFATVEASRERS